jgi:hypothetical protein
MIDLEHQDGGLSILRWHTVCLHKCTRIDLAIDVKDNSLLMGDIEQMASEHNWKGTAHSSTTIKSNDGKGCTVYMGSRSSERFVRIYDKAAQLAQLGDWVRIEAEIKGDSARGVARAIAASGSEGLGIIAQSVIKRVCDFPCKEWDYVFDGKIIDVGTPKENEKQTEKWILGQVASAIAKFERQHPDKKILERLWEQVSDILGE